MTLVHSVLDNAKKKTGSDSNSVRFVEVSCLEACPSSKGGAGGMTQNLILFDLILYQFKFSYLPSFDFESRCDNPASFIERISELLVHICCTDNTAHCKLTFDLNLNDSSIHLLA